jgi:uncharacterized protein (DUF2236 family)
MAIAGATTPEADQDYGLLGPDSVAWRILSRPGGLIGGLLALMLQALHPLAMAGVAQHSDFRRRPLDRLERTSMYVIAAVYGDTATARQTAAIVKAIHKKVHGIDPVTGRAYSAADPETQLWVHSTIWHSLLVSYRVFGGTLTPDEEDQYIAEGVPIAELIGLPAGMVPASMAEMREYFASMDSQLCMSRDARAAIDFVLNPPLTRELLVHQLPIRLFARGAIALMPRHIRAMAGLGGSRLADAVAISTLRPIVATIAIPQVERTVMGPIVGHGTVRLKQEALRVMASRVNGASAMAAR